MDDLSNPRSFDLNTLDLKLVKEKIVIVWLMQTEGTGTT